MKDNTVRLQRAVALLVLIVVAGAGWYHFVERYSPLDAFYMAIMTITTVGFQETRPLGTSAKVFTMLYTLVGVGLAFYTVVALVESVLVGEVAEALGVRRNSRRVRGMERHHVLCGFGRVGQAIAHELRGRSIEFVIVDRDPQQATVAREFGYLVVLGDATDESVLREAGVGRARVLVAAADSDAGNTFVTLTARALNPGLTIIARAASDAGSRRMVAAGADDVISPYQIAGHRMALAALQRSLQPDAAVARSEAGRALVEVAVGTTGGPEGKSVESAVAGLHTVHVLAVRRPNGDMLPGPADDHILQAGERLMLYGAQDEIDALCADEGLDTVLHTVRIGPVGPSLSAG